MLLSKSSSEHFEKALTAVLPLRTVSRKVPKGRIVTTSRWVLNNYLSCKDYADFHKMQGCTKNSAFCPKTAVP